MPSTVTHEYFYRDVYSQTSNNFKKKFPLEEYRKYSVGAQGHDALFFYNFWDLPGFMKRRDIVLNIGNNKFQDLCSEYIKVIIELNQKNSNESELLLYGYIMHHLLDSFLHPYLIYETEGEHMHEQVESFIDKWMIEKRANSNSSTYPVHNMISKIPTVKEETKRIISEAFLKTYDLENFGTTYIKALKQVRLFLRLFRYDPTGIKKLGYNIIDSTKLISLTFSWISYKTEYKDFEKYLNFDHKEWGNPIDKNIVSTKDVLELYRDAVLESANVISLLEEAIRSKASSDEIKNIIPNISSVYGLECGKPLVNTNLK